jgi:amino acid permease
MLGLPYGFAQAGWGVALIMLIGSGCLSAFTMHLLSLVSQEVGKGRATFFMLAERALPGYGGLAVETSVLLNVFGLSTSYLVVFGTKPN